MSKNSDKPAVKKYLLLRDYYHTESLSDWIKKWNSVLVYNEKPRGWTNV